ASNSSLKSSLGISSRFNTSDNDGTITRFGWKAQNKSLLLFAAEAYNVEMGVFEYALSAVRRLHALSGASRASAVVLLGARRTGDVRAHRMRGLPCAATGCDPVVRLGVQRQAGAALLPPPWR